MCKYQLLEEAYSDKHFKEELQNKRLIIEKELSKVINYINSSDSIKLKIFENLESRLKSTSSFCEKIKRKNYIETWDLPEGKDQIQRYICANLPDIIGFRINCFFYEDEKIIYEELKKYFDNEKFSRSYSLNFDENTRQANGHTIYKVSGKYEEDFVTNFEIQIKCSVHNIWGEVEHSRIYKNEHYDPKIESKKSITEEVFNILKSSDQQLKTIFEEKYSKSDLIKSLFYQYTYESITEEANITVLSKHYQHFFDIFGGENHEKVMKQFISKKLMEVEYQLESLEVSDSTVITVAEFKERYIPFGIDILNRIASLLYSNLDSDRFINYLIEIQEVSAKSYDDEFTDEFTDTDEEDIDNSDIKNTIFTVYDGYFELKEEKEV